MSDPSTLTHQAFATGFSQAQRDEVTEPTQFLSLQNTRFDKRGGVSKREGFTSFASTRMDGSSRPSGYKLFAYKDQPVVIDGHQLDAYSQATGRWRTLSRVPECTVERVPVPFPGGTALFNDVTYANGYLVTSSSYTTGATNTVTVTVLDATTYAIVSGPTVIASGISPLWGIAKLMPHGNGTSVAVVYGSAANNLSGSVIDLTSATTINTGWAAPTLLASDWDPTLIFDVHGLEDRFVLAYANTSGGGSPISIKTLNSNLTSAESTTVATGGGVIPKAIALAGSNADTLWIAYCDATNNAWVKGLQGNVLASVLATASQVLVGSMTSLGIVVNISGGGRLVGSTSAVGSSTLQVQSFVTSGGAVATFGVTQITSRLQLVSRPWKAGGRYFCAAVPATNASSISTNPFKAHFIVDVTGPGTGSRDTIRVVANICAGLALNPNTWNVHYAAISATKFAVINCVAKSTILNTGNGAGLEVAILDFAATNRWQAAPFGANVYLSGGVGTYFDGQRVREMNFLQRPDPPVAALGGAGGPTATACKYVAIFEKVDSAGNIELSSPSDVSNALSPANQAVSVTCPTLAVTTQQDATATTNPVRIGIYRSGDNGAVPFYRVGSVDNDSTSNLVAYTDVTTSAITSNAKLYTQPGVLGTAQVRQCPPSLAMLLPFNGMLVGVADDLFSLWYSSAPVIGEGLWWSAIFQVPVPDGGKIMALGELDSRLYVFKRRAVYVVDGKAPSDNGGSGGLGNPQRVASDVGCTNQRSVVTTTSGIFFQSERGIEILDRSLTVSSIGEAVRDTLAAYPIITSAVLDSRKGIVIFTLAASETANQAGGNGPRLVYDLTLQVWASLDDVYGTSQTQPAQSAALICTGTVYRYAWLATDGTVYYESGSYLDGSTWITMLAETGWHKPGGLQGWAQIDRVLLLAGQKTNHDLTLTAAYDFGAYGAVTRTWSAPQLSALALEQLMLTSADNAKCTAIKIKVQDATPSGGLGVTTGQGGTWVGLTFEGTVDRSATRLPDGAG